MKSSIFSCDLRSPGWPKGMMGGAAGVEVRHIRGPHFRLAFVTVSGNISNLYQKKFNFKQKLMTVGARIPNVFGIQMVECLPLTTNLGQCAYPNQIDSINLIMRLHFKNENFIFNSIIDSFITHFNSKRCESI